MVQIQESMIIDSKQEINLNELKKGKSFHHIIKVMEMLVLVHLRPLVYHHQSGALD